MHGKSDARNESYQGAYWAVGQPAAITLVRESANLRLSYQKNMLSEFCSLSSDFEVTARMLRKKFQKVKQPEHYGSTGYGEIRRVRPCQFSYQASIGVQTYKTFSANCGQFGRTSRTVELHNQKIIAYHLSSKSPRHADNHGHLRLSTLISLLHRSKKYKEGYTLHRGWYWAPQALWSWHPFSASPWIEGSC